MCKGGDEQCILSKKRRALQEAKVQTVSPKRFGSFCCCESRACRCACTCKTARVRDGSAQNSGSGPGGKVFLLGPVFGFGGGGGRRARRLEKASAVATTGTIRE
jgi:hypothetical protein